MNCVPFPGQPVTHPWVAVWLDFNPIFKAYYDSFVTMTQLCFGFPMLVRPHLVAAVRPWTEPDLNLRREHPPMQPGETMADFVLRRPDLWETGYRMYLPAHMRGQDDGLLLAAE